MSRRSAELASHLEVFNQRLMDFIESLDDDCLDIVIPSIGYSLRTVSAQLSGPRHYGLSHMISFFLEGGEFPDFDQEDFMEAGRIYIQSHSGWGKARILAALKEEGASAVVRVSALSDEDLARTMNLKKFGNDITLDQAISWIIIGASVEALETMRRTVFQGTPLG